MSSHFQIGVLSRERPVDTSPFVITATLPGIDFASERGTVWQAAIEALAIEDADFDFRHIQPTGVLWRVVKDDASQEFVGGADAKHLLEAFAEMRVQVVEYQVNATRSRIDLFDQILHEGHEIRFGAVVGNTHGPSPTFGFDGHE